MAPVDIKSTKTKRGFTYSYQRAVADAGKPTLLFLHGFPEGSYCWRNQVKYLGQKGYGVVCPDLLGYGGTSKLTDVKAYSFKGHCQDLTDILDHEGVQKVVVIGHDWQA
jgi:soluble epoxide hydrolase/lipid-phosphate phosphatase